MTYWTGLAMVVLALIGMGMLIENTRASFKRPRKVKPRKVPPMPEEWSLSRDVLHQDIQTPEALARNFLNSDQKDTA